MPVPFAFTKVATRRIAGLLVATMFAVDVPIANAQRAMDSRTCAAYFWVGQQCALPQFRDSYTNAFMFLARANAQREGRPSPLTQDDAILQLAATLREWEAMAGPQCENVTAIRDLYQGICLKLLRQ